MNFLKALYKGFWKQQLKLYPQLFYKKKLVPKKKVNLSSRIFQYRAQFDIMTILKFTLIKKFDIVDDNCTYYWHT